ncbi:MAG: hypothetical protein E6J90_30155 [Deltaproteobacteria bacterium]|nr:MAG: hypothetical protein E6J91_40790 [Deltaproteobacteria bacterium]TMQ12832.1 MAG: hypothetical protein E6J90_30155 [Deltaproteobacteria bacterium]
MRHVTLTISLALGLAAAGAQLASATPFEPATIPDSAQAAGHLDVDALRKTQIFAGVGGQAAIDAALNDAPAEMQPVVRMLAQSARGVSFWYGADHGAVYLETRDGRALSQLLGKLPVKPTRTVDGVSTYAITAHGSPHFVAVFGDTLVLADADASLETSLHVLAGKAGNLAGSKQLPMSTRQGVFVLVTLGDNMLGAIQKHAHSKVLQLGLRSVAIDVSESGGMLVANARAEMRSADAVQKARSILDGLRALASLSDEPAAGALVDGITVTSNGLSIDVVARLPVSQIIPMIQAHHGHHKQMMDKHRAKDKAKAKSKDSDDDND